MQLIAMTNLINIDLQDIHELLEGHHFLCDSWSAIWFIKHLVLSDLQSVGLVSTDWSEEYYSSLLLIKNYSVTHMCYELMTGLLILFKFGLQLGAETSQLLTSYSTLSWVQGQTNEMDYIIFHWSNMGSNIIYIIGQSSLAYNYKNHFNKKADIII